MTDVAQTVTGVLSQYGARGLQPAFVHSDMSTSVAIMALPRAMDPIRLVGDEEKHATVLYFGDMGTLPDDAKSEILTTMSLIAKMVSPFSERIVDLKRLGSDTPPALVAMLDGQNLKSIYGMLQVNPKLRDYLTNAQQYPSYTPHVTLGYPDYAGEEELRKSATQLNRISFDRLALWWGDERIEISLSSLYAESQDEAAWTEDLVNNFLAHYGRRGMKWGQHIFTSSKKAMGGSSEDASAARKVLSKPAHSVSSADIQVALNRMRLEQQFRDMQASLIPPSRAQRVGQFVSKLLTDVGREQTTRVAKAASAVAVERALKGKDVSVNKKFAKEVGKRITPGGSKKKK